MLTGFVNCFRFLMLFFLLSIGGSLGSSGYLMKECGDVVGQIQNAGNVNNKIAESEKSFIGTSLMGVGSLSEDDMGMFLRKHNANISLHKARLFAKMYIEEAGLEGVNHDIAFVQMCLETGFLSFGGVVSENQNNFCGLGVVNRYRKGCRFSEPKIGVRAHIQHLKAYGCAEPLKMPLVDRRFHLVKRGCSPTIYGLTGRWASDRQYASKLMILLGRVYKFSA